ncbi:hypothetical protein Y1Q_0011656 [Alligator mississippiensis]|uniref:Uncharacterized protein n=1 Tax=Alligator mississippiensis TaxID=8496 RepID=A0A151M0M2_ALLMI|nr:hypothetical protein Y1Q_0011656 [Alligator mississippiensis]
MITTLVRFSTISSYCKTFGNYHSDRSLGFLHSWLDGIGEVCNATPLKKTPTGSTDELLDSMLGNSDAQ